MDVTEAGANTNGTPTFNQHQQLFSFAQDANEEQDSIEGDISFTAESFLHENWKDCPKDPEHKDFIPIEEFTLDNLPECYRVPELFDLIKHLAHLTVKITVSPTSIKRPEYHPDGYKYPPKKKGSPSVGSGRVWDVRKIDGQPCPCKTCTASATPLTSWGEVNIVTATHVVFNEYEGKRVISSLGYDNENSKVVTLEGTGVGRADIKTDLSYVRCRTHDVGLVDQLDIHLDKYKNNCEKLFEMFSEDKPRLIVIVSHPHGCYKHVSVGDMVDSEETSSGDSKYMYTASTCGGSSGPPVYYLGKEKGWWCSHPHCRAKGGVNISGIGWL